MSNQPATNDSCRRCADCGSPHTYNSITENGTPYPHWYHHTTIEDAWRCGKCERNQSYHNNLPTKEQSEEIRKRRKDKKVCEDCKKPTSDIQLPWHHHTDKDGAWLCATCYQRRYYAPKKKFKTREEQYAYLGKLFSGEGNPMYGVHINIGRTYTDERNRKVSEAVKKWAAEHPEHYKQMGAMGALAARKLGLSGLPTQLEKVMESALKKYGIQYIAQYDFKIGVMDFYLPAAKIALFVDGAIWHADPRIYKADDIMFFGRKRSRDKLEKITAKEIWNKDSRHNAYLESLAFKVVRFWEKEIKENSENCIQLIIKTIQQREDSGKHDFP
jgi:DNA mismatch endonuclease (patch repair protein)